MTTQSKLQLISQIFRYGVIGFAFLFLTSLVLHYLLGINKLELGIFTVSLDITPWKSYQEMKAAPGVSAFGIAFFPLLTFSVISYTTFWFYRLFDYYSKGHFFGDEVMRCYVMILWTRVVDFLYTSFYDVLIWAFHPERKDFNVEVVVDMKTLFTLVVLLVITYILKLANQIDKENREFV